MKKKQKPLNHNQKFRCTAILIIILGCIGVGLIHLMNNPHVQFRLQNILAPVTGEFVFHSPKDGDWQIYSATFNTGWDQISLTKLTDHPEGALNPVYSPDGQQIVYRVGFAQHGNSIFVMNADGTNPHQITHGYQAYWLNHHQLIVQREIGYYVTNSLNTCYIYAPFQYDLNTGEEYALFGIPESSDTQIDDNGFYHFPGHEKLYTCRLGDPLEYKLPDELDLRLEASVWLNSAPESNRTSMKNRVLNQPTILAPDGSTIATAIVYPYRDYVSGIYVQEDNDLRLVEKAHVTSIGWSPDSRYLIYTALHPEGNSVIGLSSIDGTYTYPLLGDDGNSYYAPNWRPHPESN